PDKDPVGQIKAYASAEVAKKVVAADKVRAADEVTVQERRVKAHALRPDSRRQVQLGAFAQRRTIDRVNSIEEGTERLHGLVQVLAGAKGCVEAYAEILVKKKIQAEVGIRSAANRLRLGSALRSHQAGNAEGQIKLLRLRRVSRHKKQTRGRDEQQESFQDSSPITYKIKEAHTLKTILPFYEAD